MIYAIKVLLAAGQSIGPIAVDSGIVAGAVKTPIEFANPPERSVDVLRLRDVNTDENCLAASLLDLAGGLVAGLLLKIGNMMIAPSSAIRSATAWPIPEAAPVTKTTLPESLSPMSRSLSTYQSGPLGLK